MYYIINIRAFIKYTTIDGVLKLDLSLKFLLICTFFGHKNGTYLLFDWFWKKNLGKNLFLKRHLAIIQHSSSSPPPRHRSTLRSEAEIRLNSQSRARSLSTPKKLPIENLLKNFEEVDKEENKFVVEMEKPEIPIGRPLIVYDNSSGMCLNY